MRLGNEQRAKMETDRWFLARFHRRRRGWCFRQRNRSTSVLFWAAPSWLRGPSNARPAARSASFHRRTVGQDHSDHRKRRIPAAADAIPVNPNNAATSATMRKINAHLSIFDYLLNLNRTERRV